MFGKIWTAPIKVSVLFGILLLSALAVTAAGIGGKQQLTITAEGYNFTYCKEERAGYDHVSVQDNLVDVTDLVAVYYPQNSTQPCSGIPTAVGCYTVVLSIPESNEQYYGSTQQTFIISPKSTSVTGTQVSNKVYDTTVQAQATVGTLEGIAAGDDVTVVVNSATFSDANVGAYKNVTVSYALIGNDAGNYSEPEDGNLIADIEQARVIPKNLTASPITYGQALSQSVLSGEAVLGSETVLGTWHFKNGAVCPTVSDSTKTGFEVIFTPDSSELNYKETETVITVPVIPKMVTVTAQNQTADTPNSLPSFAATVQGLLGSDTVNYSLRTETVTGKGEYRIIPYGEAIQGNYRLSFVSGTLTVENDMPQSPQTGDSFAWIDGVITALSFCGILLLMKKKKA